MSKPTVRPAERNAFCRICDKVIPKGETMVTWYSHRGQGMNIHLHLECTKQLGNLAREELTGVV